MELTSLLERMKMEHLLAQLDGVCEYAAKGDLDDKGVLTEALEAEWRGRHQRSVESRLKLARLPWVKTLDQFDFDFQPSIASRCGSWLASASSSAPRTSFCSARLGWARPTSPLPSASRPSRPATRSCSSPSRA